MLAIATLLAAQMFAFAQGSRLWIEGDSNIHRWSCQATAPEARIEIDKDAPQLARSLTLRVKVAGLECGDGKMNEKLRDALHAEQHPFIEYRLLKAERTSSEPLQLQATGELIINGKTQLVVFLVDVTLEANGTASAKGSVDILMSEYGVEPPTAMLGLIKSYDGIAVNFEIHTVLVSAAHASVP
jgi:polyisoprenoid-binding protein YceI